MFKCLPFFKFVPLLLSFFIASLHAQDFDAKEFFEINCMVCHNAGGLHDLDMGYPIGPDLSGVTNRRDRDWIIAFIKNPEAVVGQYDPDYISEMPPYDFLSHEEIVAIVNYLETFPKVRTLSEEEKPRFAGAGVEKTPPSSGGGLKTEGYVLIFGGLALLLLAGITFKTGNIRVAQGSLVVFLMLGVGIGAKEIVQFAKYTDYAIGYAPLQPINFSHKVHAGDNEISCMYCHYGVDKGIHGTIPPVNLCLNCHTHVANQSIEVQKVYEAIEERRSIEWEKVHHFPDHARFNHSVHINSGLVSCTDCHGAVEEMDVVMQVETMGMGFCLECHRQHDEAFLPENRGMIPGKMFDCASCHH